MPRPGPRPYECIRRAWHSDSHQPLRGRLIQEIFRVVNELHSTSTRRKKEWQEKLPIVVLRAEEILYSKANSESEYMDVATLRTRLDDAVNTMIRREESDESGPYLPPCVEAALSLGCPPKKNPRGHRQRPPNGGRRSSSSSANATPVLGVTAATKSFDGAANADSKLSSSSGTIQEAASSSPSGSQSLARQDQGQSPNLCNSVCSPFDSRPSVVPCYSVGANTLPSSVFPGVHEASHSLVEPSFPHLGLVDFGTAAHGRRHCGFPASINSGPFSQMLPKFNPETRTTLCVEPMRNAGARVELLCINPNGSMNFASTLNSPISTSPVSTLSRMPHLRSREGFTISAQQTGQTSGNITAARMDSARCKVGEHIMPFPVDIQSRLQLQMSSRLTNNLPHAALETPSLRNHFGAWTQEIAVSSARLPLQKTTLPVASAENGNTPWSTDVHDLQLRLGPPGKEPILAGADSLSEQLTTKSWQLTKGTLMRPPWREFENSLGPGSNAGTPKVLPCMFGLDINGCGHVPVMAVDEPAPKRLRGDSSCENRMQLGSSLPSSMHLTWPRR